MADSDTILAATVLHAWEELCRNKLVETFLFAAAITQVGGLLQMTVLTKVYYKYSPEIPIALEVSSLLQYHINSALCSWKMWSSSVCVVQDRNLYHESSLLDKN